MRIGDRVASGTRLVTDAGETMGEIVQGVRRVAEIVNEIATADSEQSGGIGQASRCITACNPSGITRGTFSTRPPPVMCARPCTGTSARSLRSDLT